MRSFEARHDDYSAILAKALADRLAEAFAERLHERVRRELWGYAPDEALSNAELVAERYQGIRPAPGYPACPDHTEKRTLFALLEAEARAGIRLTESWAMLPGASVSGYYFWHPQSAYFGVGRIGRDQLEDYAARAGIPVADAARILGPEPGRRAGWLTDRDYRPAPSRDHRATDWRGARRYGPGVTPPIRPRTPLGRLAVLVARRLPGDHGGHLRRAGARRRLDAQHATAPPRRPSWSS